jgi:hypothetical protein
LQKPTCGRCQRFGISCVYSERGWTFVEQAGVKSEQVTRRSASPPSSRSSIPSHRGLIRTVLEIQTDGAFWDVYLPHEDPSLDGVIGGVTAAPWISTVRDMAEEGGYLRVALQACAFVGLGWIRDDLALVQHGAQLYTQALRQINEALRDPVEARSDVALGCCRVLSLFEMFRRSSSLPLSDKNQVNDWQSHVEGSCQLIELRGFEKHANGRGLALYDGVRMTAVISGIARRKPNAVTESTWLPPGPQSPRDKLYFLVGSIINAMERMDRLTEAMTSNLPQSVNLLEPACQVIEQIVNGSEGLIAWETDVLSLCGRTRRGTPNMGDSSKQQSSADQDQMLLECCKSHGYGFFFLCAEYWAICVRTYHHAQTFHQRSADLYGPHVPDVPAWMNPEPYALKIATVASHYFLPEAGLWSAQSAIFPISSALSYYAQTGRIGTEPCRAMFAAFTHNKAGTVLLDFLRSIRVAGDRNRE